MNNDRISEVYKGEIWAQEAQERARRRIHWMVEQAERTRVLDVGCSQGIASILLGREGYEVIGIDIEASRIEYANADLARESEDVRSRVSFMVADGETLEFADNFFDSVLIGEVLEHLDGPHHLLAEVTRVLRPGGVLVVTTPFGLLPHHDHKQCFYADELLSLVTRFAGVVSAEIADRYFRVVGRKAAPNEPAVLASLRKRAASVVRGIQEEFFAIEKDLNRVSSKLETSESSLLNQRELVAQLERRVRESDQQSHTAAQQLKQSNEQSQTSSRLSDDLARTRRTLETRDRQARLLEYRLAVANWKIESLRLRRWWRIGAELSETRRIPRSIVTLPVRLLRVINAKSPRLPRPTPPPELKKSESNRISEETEIREEVARDPIEPRYDVPVLALANHDLREQLSYEVQIFDLDLQGVRGQIAALSPHFVLVQSSAVAKPLASLRDLLATSSSSGVPVVLWNDDRSTIANEIEEQFDVIVGDGEPQTDNYHGMFVRRQGLVQPRIHNPIGSVRQRDAADIVPSERRLADNEYSGLNRLVAAAKDFKILRTTAPTQEADMAPLAATATPVIAVGGHVYGSSISVDSEEEAAALERSLLRSDVLRARLSHPRMRQVLRKFSISQDVRGFLNHANTDWPQIDIMVATKRPEKLELLFENLGRQTYPSFRVFLVVHGVTLDEERTKSLADDAGVHLAKLIHVPEKVILGEVFNIGFGETEADIVAKMDDDDIYGAEYLWDLYSALDFSNAEVAGKWAHYAYLQGPNTLVYRYRDFEHRFTDVVAISTLLMRREVLEVERFPEMPWGSGSVFLRALGAQGGRVFAADRWNYLYVRAQDGDRNTFPISDLRLLAISDVVCRGMNIEEVLV